MIEFLRLSGVDYGIADYMAGLSPMNSIIYSTKYRGLHIIPAGGGVSKSYERPSNSRLSELISRLKRGYDYIIFNGASIYGYSGILNRYFWDSSLNFLSHY